MKCATCESSRYRTTSTMFCDFGVAPVVVLRAFSCDKYKREPGADDDEETQK